MRNGKLFGVLLGAIAAFACGQEPVQFLPGVWSRAYGGTSYESASSLVAPAAGGFVVAATTASFGCGREDFWVLRLAWDGYVAWQKTYGGSSDDIATCLQQTADGGYIVCGDEAYIGGDGHTFRSSWILKLASDGAITWQKAYGGGGTSYLPDSIQETADGGYIAAGRTGNFNAWDFFVLQLSSDGAVAWMKTYGYGIMEVWTADTGFLQQTDDGGYMLVGTIYTSNRACDVFLLKLAFDGTVSWVRTYGGSKNDRAAAFLQTGDGGYALAGSTESSGSGYRDLWVMKLSEDGSAIWQKTCGGTGEDFASDIRETADGGYLVAGHTDSFSTSGAWVLELAGDGSVKWQCCFPGSDAACILELPGGGVVVAGCTYAFGTGDVWVLKIPLDGRIPGAGFVVDTLAIAAESSLAPSSVGVRVTSGSAVMTDTSVSGMDSTVAVQTQYP